MLNRSPHPDPALRLKFPPVTSALSLNSEKPLPDVALRYARALYDLAQERGQLPMVEADTIGLATALKDSKDLATLVASPLQRRATLGKAVKALLGAGKASALTQSFAETVIMNGRAAALPVILDAFAALIAQAKGLVVARVTSARPLSDASRKALETALVSALADKGVKDIALKTKVDESLIGGMRVEVGPWLYDGSLKGKLQDMAQFLRG